MLVFGLPRMAPGTSLAGRSGSICLEKLALSCTGAGPTANNVLHVEFLFSSSTSRNLWQHFTKRILQRLTGFEFKHISVCLKVVAGGMRDITVIYVL